MERAYSACQVDADEVDGEGVSYTHGNIEARGRLSPQACKCPPFICALAAGVALVQNAQAKATVVEREEAVDDVKERNLMLKHCCSHRCVISEGLQGLLDGSPALVVAYDGNLEACCGRMRGVYARSHAA
eukprot:228814-Amphidinium_carterae.1